jgi:anionic cell wall polymer biosynthesis LytR-Cps2A-Psr (LCP) family protein
LQIDEGKQIMDGNTALNYARSRHSTSDFDRSRRQQIVIKALLNKLLSFGSLTKLK